ncbi:ribonucleoside-diphosphate reductase subunit alpha [Rugamonas aquatica]|nr:ribonucleoside-diphosphate reductase subunit alpha [Rugamonas aquatica]
MSEQTMELRRTALVLKRDGSVVRYDASKIRRALECAFLNDENGVAWVGGQSVLAQSQMAQIDELVEHVDSALAARPEKSVPIEEIQDLVEQALMHHSEHRIARGYVLYRAARKAARTDGTHRQRVTLRLADGASLSLHELEARVADCASKLPMVDIKRVAGAALRDLFDGAGAADVDRALLLAARSLMETDPEYDQLAAGLLLGSIQREVLGEVQDQRGARAAYRDHFPRYIAWAVDAGLLDARMKQFDCGRLAQRLCPERDGLFRYLGLQTLHDRYLQRDGERLLEHPQAMFMRIAMGLAIGEADREFWAIEFYQVLSRLEFLPSTPTLFNAGTARPQLASCFLTTVPDDLEGIYDAIKENALLAKYSGGLGNDWTPVRAMGSRIKGTNGKSQGVVPFLKVVNDTAVAVNQGGKRQGAVCAYLETWHMDIEQFLELRKNVGDDRRRTHDMNTAGWIPDLFMKRVLGNSNWTLFSPSDVPDLHDLYGKAFDEAYQRYERLAARGAIDSRTVAAKDLWRKMLTMLYETGHPWITFKDPCNVRNPQQHAGVVHSSNLCTEVTLNTCADEVAVCNLGSVNLVVHLVGGKYDFNCLRRTISVAMRMLDNSIDLNLYTVDKAGRANQLHRPVGLGMMGFQDVLHATGIAYGSPTAVAEADSLTEMFCYFAYWASTELAEERGRYGSYAGSLWDKGVLPRDTLDWLAAERGADLLDVDRESYAACNYGALLDRIRAFGMRNSNCVAIAPTATIANIAGVSPSNEPAFQQLYVKSNLFGEFTELNQYLVRDLKYHGLWDAAMVADLKHYDGSVANIERVPKHLKEIYRTAFETDPRWLVEAAARRQKWVDQAQSLTLYVVQPSGSQLDELYGLAWRRGLKTTYYLRVVQASGVDKSTGRAGGLNAVPVTQGIQCALGRGEDGGPCEACQ